MFGNAPRSDMWIGINAKGKDHDDDDYDVDLAFEYTG